MNPVSLYTSKVSGETGPGTGMAGCEAEWHRDTEVLSRCVYHSSWGCWYSPDVFTVHLGVVGTGSRRGENMAGTAHD